MNAYTLIKPVITEKTLLLAQTRNEYTFQTQRTASKEQIKRAVEDLYQVNVISVNTIMSHNELKATGRKRLKTVTARIKKAVIKLKVGQTIALFDIQGGQAA